MAGTVVNGDFTERIKRHFLQLGDPTSIFVNNEVTTAAERGCVNCELVKELKEPNRNTKRNLIVVELETKLWRNLKLNGR